MTIRVAVVSVVVCLVSHAAQASPILEATYAGANLQVLFSWSSDLGPVVVSSTGPYVAGPPITRSGDEVRNGRAISGTITQTGPYVLDDLYWAASWSGSLNVPGGGFYGLGVGGSGDGTWSFHQAGVSDADLANRTLYFAAMWDIVTPADIHPSFSVGGIHPVTLTGHGEATGEFQLYRDFFQYGLPGFRGTAAFGAGTSAQDSNQPGTMDFFYTIAFSATPIDARIFNAPAPTVVPEPGTLLMTLGPLATLVARRWKRRR